MLDATEEERQHVIDYMTSAAPDESVNLIQKVYSERLGSVMHDIWDVRTNQDRWWVITQPMNLYSQEKFPEMDLALTFHAGLCLRIPNCERDRSYVEVEPFMASWRRLEQASAALRQADEVEAFQAIGMRCREALISLVQAASSVVSFAEEEEAPQKANFVVWSEKIADTVAGGQSNAERRGLLKSTAKSAWQFVSWLTHARSATHIDAEAALGCTEQVLGLYMSMWIRHARGVPEACPECGSYKLAPERGSRTDQPEVIYERPTCRKCGWKGEPSLVRAPAVEGDRRPPESDCVIPSVPLIGPPPPKPSRDKCLK
ncbi:MAG TPA: hypothetical protein VKM54_21880 [Myxococcota bacterium]|nr:hypothetical protein [Myxococcota bacterium]